jgi:fused signal recognition particle receptor
MFSFFKKKDENKDIPQDESQKASPFDFKLSFGGFKEALSKTTEAITDGIASVISTGEKIDDDMLDEIEEVLIKADVGVDLSAQIVDKIRVDKDKITTDKLNDIIKQEFKTVLQQAGSNELSYKEGLNIFLITGVNGAGKTTLIGKLAYRFKTLGAKVLVAAGDTFRAAAEEQLDIWSKRAGAEIVRRDGADSASVVYDAIKKAQEEGFDVLLIDTAGRLQNKFNLMEELKKIKKVIDNEADAQIAESILVIDANTGQNGLSQAEVFQEAVQITAVGLTKLDGSAKGGIIAGIAKKLNLPVKLIGVGEKMEDLKDFSADDFVEALFG